MATEVTDAGTDSHYPVLMVEATQQNPGALPQMTLADSGYASEANFAALAREGGKVRRIDPDKQPAIQRMAERMSTDQGQAHYRRRKAIPEPVFGWTKQVMEFRQFSVRGQWQVNGEWNLVCLAQNLRRMHRLGWWRPDRAACEAMVPCGSDWMGSPGRFRTLVGRPHRPTAGLPPSVTPKSSAVLAGIAATSRKGPFQRLQPMIAAPDRGISGRPAFGA